MMVCVVRLDRIILATLVVALVVPRIAAAAPANNCHPFALMDGSEAEMALGMDGKWKLPDDATMRHLSAMSSHMPNFLHCVIDTVIVLRSQLDESKQLDTSCSDGDINAVLDRDIVTSMCAAIECHDGEHCI